MATLSELVLKVDQTAKAGDRQKALRMLETLIAKVPEDKSQALLKRRKMYREELATEQRIIALEKLHAI
jgi:hypothetical protein